MDLHLSVVISTKESKSLNAVESLFEDAESIAKAIGNASKVVVTIGPTEDGPANEVTTSDALLVVQAAQLAGVSHVAIVYDDSASSASPANVLNGISTFFNTLFSKSQQLSVADFLEKLVQMDVKYTFIRANLTDDFSPESGYNVVVAAEGSAGENDYKVARSQMASLVANLVSDTQVAEDKVVEVYADPSAPLKPLGELFSAIPEDGRRKGYAETIAKAKAEEARQGVEEAAESNKRVEEERKRVTEQEPEDTKQKAEESAISMNAIFNKAKDFSSGFSWDNFGSQFAPTNGTTKVEVATVRGQTKAWNLAPQKAVVKQAATQLKSKSKAEPKLAVGIKTEDKPKDKEKAEVRKILGGIFKQETIYVDDD